MPRPMPYPRAAPSAIWSTNIGTRSTMSALGSARSRVNPMVRKMAIGSLLPDSSSSRGLSRPVRAMLLERSTAKIAAASVEETMAPSSRPSSQAKPSTAVANHPTRTAVSATPSVASARAGQRTGRTLSQWVSKPPAKRMKVSATTPSDCASRGSSNSIPPGPSDPASIPSTRNSSSAGTPTRPDTLLPNTDRSNTRETASSRCSIDMNGRALPG